MIKWDEYLIKQEEPLRSCLIAIKALILDQDKKITPAWKYGMPFFYIEKRMFCYLWINKKTHQPYIGFMNGYEIEHPDLIKEKRSRVKIFQLDSNQDLPVEKLSEIIQMSLALHKKKYLK